MTARRIGLPNSLFLGDGAIGIAFPGNEPSLLAAKLSLFSLSFRDAVTMPPRDGDGKGGSETADGARFRNPPGKGRACSLSRGTSA